MTIRTEKMWKVLAKHFKPTPSVIVERFKFHSCFRKQGESVSTFVAELHSLSEYCNFGDTLEVMIRDRLVCVINDNGIQRRLLAEQDLTYKKTVELAQSLETAMQNMKDLKTKKDEVVDVHKMFKKKTELMTVRKVCYRCGNRGYIVAKCKVNKEVICHRCGKSGHLQKRVRVNKGIAQSKGQFARKYKLCVRCMKKVMKNSIQMLCFKLIVQEYHQY